MSASTGLQARSNTIKEDRRGQSFIEAMVALTIIITAVSSSLALVQASLTSTRISSSQVIAANLAREGIEVARSIRDSNWLRGEAFQVGLVQGTAKDARPFFSLSDGSWSFDFTTATLEDDASLLYVLSEGAYVHADAQPPASSRSQYHRIVTLDHICRNDVSGAEAIMTGSAECGASETLVGLVVRPQVSFKGLSGGLRTVTAEERLYDWR